MCRVGEKWGIARLGLCGRIREEELGKRVKPAVQRRVTALLMDSGQGRGLVSWTARGRNAGAPGRHKVNWSVDVGAHELPCLEAGEVARMECWDRGFTGEEYRS